MDLRKGTESGLFLRLRPNQLTWKPDAVNIEQQSMQDCRLFQQVSLCCVGNEDAVVGNCVNYSFPPVFPLSNMLPDRWVGSWAECGWTDFSLSLSQLPRSHSCLFIHFFTHWLFYLPGAWKALRKMWAMRAAAVSSNPPSSWSFPIRPLWSFQNNNRRLVFYTSAKLVDWQLLLLLQGPAAAYSYYKVSMFLFFVFLCGLKIFSTGKWFIKTADFLDSKAHTASQRLCACVWSVAHQNCVMTPKLFFSIFILWIMKNAQWVRINKKEFWRRLDWISLIFQVNAWVAVTFPIKAFTAFKDNFCSGQHRIDSTSTSWANWFSSPCIQRAGSTVKMMKT